MKLPSSAIALTLMFGTILVIAPIQPVTAEHSPTENKQSFKHKPERVSKTQVCHVQLQPCGDPIPLALPRLKMSDNELNEPLPFINNFHTILESPKKKMPSLLKIMADSFREAVENPPPPPNPVGNSSRRVPFRLFRR